MINVFQPTKIVLVADDDPAHLLLLQNIIEQLGLAVVSAKNGQQAVECFNRHIPDLVLLDIKMPIMNGLEASKQIRQSKQGQDVPIVLITGSDDDDSIKQAFDLGVTDFITKPVIWPILSHRIRYLLKANTDFLNLKSSERRLKKTQKLAAIGHWELNLSTQTVELSEQMYSLLNIARADFNHHRESFLSFLPVDAREEFNIVIQQAVHDTHHWELDHTLVTLEGIERVVHQQGEVIFDEHGKPYLIQGMMQDITKRKLAEEKVRHLAYYDSLTGLPNRLHFMENAKSSLQIAQQTSCKVGLIFLDIDNFKRINDSLGHGAGDILLQKFSQRLIEELRDNDYISKTQISSFKEERNLVSRLGGDEFTIVLTELNSRKEITNICERLIKKLSEPMNLGDNSIIVSGSFGIAMFPDDGKDLETLMRHADIAMYETKKHGKNNLSFYNEAFEHCHQEHLSLEVKLRNAIENDLITAYYQPQIDIEEGLLNGAEALARWNDAELGNIPPDTFIPLAEDCGLIVQLGDKMMMRVCRQAKHWQDKGHQPIVFAVNVSAQQFSQENFSDKVLRCLHETGLAAKYLEIEITESMLMDSLDLVIDHLNRLKKIGVHISIDDFGTGFSSMSYLKLLPIDKLKIDCDFISGLAKNSPDNAIVKAIIELSHGLKLNVIAEGVETIEQQNFLIDNRCKNVQGFFYSIPLEPAIFEQKFLQTKSLQYLP